MSSFCCVPLQHLCCKAALPTATFSLVPAWSVLMISLQLQNEAGSKDYCLTAIEAAPLSPHLYFSLESLLQFRPLVLSRGTMSQVSMKKHRHIKLKRSGGKLRPQSKSFLERTRNHSSLPDKSHFEHTYDDRAHMSFAVSRMRWPAPQSTTQGKARATEHPTTVVSRVASYHTATAHPGDGVNLQQCKLENLSLRKWCASLSWLPSAYKIKLNRTKLKTLGSRTSEEIRQELSTGRSSLSIPAPHRI